MKQNIPIPSKNIEIVAAQVEPETPVSIIELIAKQIDRAADAAGKIESEGLVVRDMRGSVIAHPAVAIEIAATKMVTELLKKHQRRAVAVGGLMDMEL